MNTFHKWNPNPVNARVEDCAQRAIAAALDVDWDTASDLIYEMAKAMGTTTHDDAAGDADYIDKLTHSLKSIKATIAMMEDEDGYSNRSYPDGMGGSYRGYSREGNRGSRSYARGRMNARRDSMGRYSGNYSRDDGMVDELRELMQDAPNEAIKRDIQRLVDKMEQM